jgi:hypothetical protein
MKGRDFLSVANYLMPLKTEASIRAQIGRLYYASYLEARTWCEVHLRYERKQYSREHAEIQRMLGAIDPELADELAFLRSYRNTADYDLYISADTLDFQIDNARRRAQSIMDRIEALPSLQSEKSDERGDE